MVESSIFNRIYEELEDAGNLLCHVLVATPHCAGKYPYVDADGYEEYPTGTGQTMVKTVRYDQGCGAGK